MWHRYEFAGGGDGTWGDAPELVARYTTTQRCAAGATVAFAWASAVPHDLVRLPSANALERCDFSSAETLAPESARGEVHLHCEAGETYFLSCSVPGHCAAGQKLRVEGSATVAAFGADGAPLLHVSSFARLYTLLGLVAVDGDGGHAELTRGFTTEAVANSTLELLWCLAPHCGNCRGGPGGAGAGGACPSEDWEGDGATNASCTADVYTLAGAIERKRPVPRLAASRGYYDDALRLAAGARRCTPLAYLAELHLQRGDAASAVEVADELRRTCGSESGAARAARAAFDAAGVAWPRDPPPASPPAPPSAPPPAPPPAPPRACMCARRRLLFGRVPVHSYHASCC